MKKLFGIALLLSQLFYAKAQELDPGRKFGPAALQQDYRIFRDTLRALHGGLYRYKSKQQIDALFAQDETKLADSLSFREFFGLVAHTASAIEDGHTNVRIPASVQHFLSDKALLFPVQLRFFDTKAYVICDTHDFPPATEIISINNVSVNNIRKKLFSYMTSDGSTESEKYWKINQADNKFFWMYDMIYGPQRQFGVVYRIADKKEHKIVNAVPLSQVGCLRPNPAYNDTTLLKTTVKDGIGIMKVKTFYNDFLKGGQRHFTSFLDSSFTALNARHIDKLVIDIRSNGGGNDNNGELLVSYFIDHPFPYFKSLTSTRKTFTVKDHSGLGIQEPDKIQFRGKVVILINGKSFSAAADFAAFMRSNTNAVFVGEETGGGYEGNTSGPRQEIFLPNTGIEIDVPENMYVNDVKPPKLHGRGIIPDYIVMPSVDDYIAVRDVQMAFALKLLSSK
ncbi:MAG: S41 family peptidase [Mucilaginibacter sp.]